MIVTNLSLKLTRQILSYYRPNITIQHRKFNPKKGPFVSKDEKSISYKDWGEYNSKQFSMLFSTKLDRVDRQVKGFISKLNEVQIEIQLFKNIDKYLKEQSYKNFLQTSPYSKVCLLVAMSVRGISTPIMTNFSKQLVEHICRHDYNQVEIEDEATLEAIFKEFQSYMKLHSQKAKSDNLKSFLLMAIKYNFLKFPLKLYPQLINFIYYSVTIQCDYYRYLQIIDLLQDSLTDIMFRLTTNKVQKEDHQFMFDATFLANMSTIYKLYKFRTDTQLQVYYKFICQKIFVVKHISYSEILPCLNILYRNFPYNIFNSEGLEYKTLLFQEFVKFLELNQPLKKELINGSYAHYFCFSIITHFLSSQLQQTPKLIHDDIQYITKQELAQPIALPDIFWQIYKERTHFSDQFGVLRNAIASCYPDKYISKNDVVKNNKKPFIETEMKIRISQTLKEMGIQYESEFQTLDRFIDFKIEEDILLEIDGLFHFSVRDFEPQDNAYFRNMHILHSGYKLITLNIYEYNIYRTKDQLKTLIQAKYDLIKNKNAILVL